MKKSLKKYFEEDDPETSDIRSVWAFVLVFLSATGLALGLLYSSEAEKIEGLRRSEFWHTCGAHVKAVQSSLEQHVQNTETLAQLFANRTDGDITREQYIGITRTLRTAPGVRAYSWNKLVQHEDRAELEAANHAYYSKRFEEDNTLAETTWEFTERVDGVLQRRRNMSEYLVVNYIEPAEQNIGAIMFDLYSAESRKRTFQAGRRTNSPQMTPRIRLVQGDSEAPDEYGVLVVTPVPSPSEDFQVSVFSIASTMTTSKNDACTTCKTNIIVGLEDISDRVQELEANGYETPKTKDGIIVLNSDAKQEELWPEDVLLPDSPPVYLGVVGVDNLLVGENTYNSKGFRSSMIYGHRIHFQLASRHLVATCLASNDFRETPLQYETLVIVGTVALALLALLVRYQHYRWKLSRSITEAKLQTQRLVMSYMCHELRNPLHVVSFIVNEELDPDCIGDVGAIESNRDAIKMLRSLVRNLHVLVNGFIDYGTLRIAETTVNNIPTNLVEMSKDVFNQAMVLSSPGIEWILEVPDEVARLNEQFEFEVDQTRITQILLNGLTNAIKHTVTGKVCLRLGVRSSSPQVKKSASKVAVANETDLEANVDVLSSKGSFKVTWEVLDTGPGLPKVIKQFSTKPRSKSEQNLNNLPSNGLGIHISSELAGRLGGILRIRNRDDGVQGAVFELEVECVGIPIDPPLWVENTNINTGNSLEGTGIPTPEANLSPTKQMSLVHNEAKHTEGKDKPGELPPIKSIPSTKSAQSVTPIQIQRHLSVSSQTSPMLTSLKVVICDDEALNRMVFTKRLRRLGIDPSNIWEYGDGAELVENAQELKAQKPDVIFLDIVMIRMDGTETCQVLRKAGFTCSIVAATGNASSEDVKHYEECGFDSVILKPFSKDQLLKILTASITKQ